MSAFRNIGIFGATFDPPHCGHAKLLEHFLFHWPAAAIEKVMVVPSGSPYQKSQVTHADQRLAMLRLWQAALPVAVNQRLHIDLRETQRQGPSYSVQTLRELQVELGQECRLWFLIGADQWRNLSTWHEWQAIFDMVNLVIANRQSQALHLNIPATQLHELQTRYTQPGAEEVKQVGGIFSLASFNHPASSSQLRALLRKQNHVLSIPPSDQAKLHNWLPARVLDYIAHTGLYSLPT